MFELALIFRLMHIMAAITAAGGTLFMRIGLLPAASAVLKEDDHARLKEAIRNSWARWVHISIGFLLISGLYNIAMIEAKKQVPIPKDMASAYHGLLMIKLVLAMGIFYIASMLAGRSEVAQSFRKDAKRWLTINCIMIAVLVCVSGAMRVIRDQGIYVPAAVAPAAVTPGAPAPAPVKPAVSEPAETK